jgi:mono/diheme cytochrome c family protein
MKPHRTSFAAAILLFAASVWPVAAQPVTTVASTPQYVPDTTHANDPMPDGVLNWDATTKSVDATNGQAMAWFVFNFTNVAKQVNLAQSTNFIYATNFTTVTNSGFWNVLSGHKHVTSATVKTNRNVLTVTNSVIPAPVAIMDAHASCGCTQPELPSRPWVLPPGTNGILRVSVNLAGKSGRLMKTVTVTTDKGRMMLMLNINIQEAPPVAPMSEEARARGIAASKLDRQAVFHGDCASCHVKNVEGKYDGPLLYQHICAVCHEASNRASMVPDLHHLKDQTSDQFWRAWITSGKPGTLMPAFATSQGGPLNEMQIASLASYLDAIIPPTPQPATPAK